MVSLLFDYVVCCYVFEKPLKTRLANHLHTMQKKCRQNLDPPSRTPPSVPLNFLVKKRKISKLYQEPITWLYTTRVLHTTAFFAV